MKDIFISPLGELAGFSGMCECLKNKETPVQLSGCVTSQKTHLIYVAGKAAGWRLIVCGNDLDARELYEDYLQLDDNVFYYPAKDLMFYQADLSGNLQLGERIGVLNCLCTDKGGTIITTIDGLMNVLPPFDAYRKCVCRVKSGQELNRDGFLKKLLDMGYKRTGAVGQPGEVAVRGDIIDVYAFSQDYPVRIELWADEVDSVRAFDAESQRSLKTFEDEVLFYPAQEMALSETERMVGLRRTEEEYERQYELLKQQENYEQALNLKQNAGAFIEQLKGGMMPGNIYSYINYFYDEKQCLLDYLPEDLYVFAVEPELMRERGEAVWEEFNDNIKHRLSGGCILPGQTELLYSPEDILARLSALRCACITALPARPACIKVRKCFDVSAVSMNSYKESTQLLISDLKKWHRDGYRVVILYSSRTKAMRMAQTLQEYNLDAFFADEQKEPLLPGQTMVTAGKLRKGFSYPYIKFVVLTEADMFGSENKKRRRTSGAYKGKNINSLSDLKPGDYVVHENYGIGIYRGIERRVVDQVARDYIRVEYGDKSSLFVPAEQFEYIQKYADSDKKVDKLSSLYGGEWKKTKSKVKADVEKVAKELVMLYAQRSSQTGYAYGKDTFWQREFEENFPYEETQDQLQAIRDVKADMESTKIMDRLICGDVGFGKTEIAIRAAFKAVSDGKQVVYLVPTTILCQQHYNTFCERMKDYPVRVEQLSRFCTRKMAEHTLEGLKRGTVDIVIGTHRVLSKDVEYHDLGLLIIDEEQRFGVAHKEKIKQLKKNVDVLTLTATPIPRTLHMSLIGIRDMSVLEEPPGDRRPIQTYVCEFSTEMVREAIVRELARGGQVYYVYNSVADIAGVAQKLKEMLPEAEVAFAHGQMSERQLERIMLDFVNGNIDVLVSTTIIETGLDIPNVNTIIISNADRFGLAQLYQLRGRVGRSSRTSYAFIMYRKNRQLSEVAEQRLMAIKELTELGSGVKIALKDLEIRGAGNLLGMKQHGNMEAVGYDLYCKLLNEAVLWLKGDTKQEDDFETKTDIPFDTYIPDEYIGNEGLRLEMYKRITTLESQDEYSELCDEMIDRFGDIPRPCANLLMMALIKVLGHELGAEFIQCTDRDARVVMKTGTVYNKDRLNELLSMYHGHLKWINTVKPYFVFHERDRTKMTLENMSTSLKTLLDDIKMMSGA